MSEKNQELQELVHGLIEANLEMIKESSDYAVAEIIATLQLFLIEKGLYEEHLIWAGKKLEIVENNDLH